jgi:hypothetical protein
MSEHAVHDFQLKVLRALGVTPGGSMGGSMGGSSGSSSGGEI